MMLEPAKWEKSKLGQKMHDAADWLDKKDAPQGTLAKWYWFGIVAWIAVIVIANVV